MLPELKHDLVESLRLVVEKFDLVRAYLDLKDLPKVNLCQRVEWVDSLEAEIWLLVETEEDEKRCWSSLGKELECLPEISLKLILPLRQV